MASDDPQRHDRVASEADSPPEIADWWVWGVRKTAAVFADLFLAARGIAVLFILFKAAVWYFTRDPGELVQLGLGVAALLALWGVGLLLGRFSAERDTPDPERWLRRRGRAK
jgi:hypothetical protein